MGNAAQTIAPTSGTETEFDPTNWMTLLKRHMQELVCYGYKNRISIKICKEIFKYIVFKSGVIEEYIFGKLKLAKVPLVVRSSRI